MGQFVPVTKEGGCAVNPIGHSTYLKQGQISGILLCLLYLFSPFCSCTLPSTFIVIFFLFLLLLNAVLFYRLASDRLLSSGKL